MSNYLQQMNERLDTRPWPRHKIHSAARRGERAASQQTDQNRSGGKCPSEADEAYQISSVEQ